MFVPWFLLFFCFGFVFGAPHTLERYVINSTQSGNFTDWIDHLNGLTADPPKFEGLCNLLEEEIRRKFAFGRESIAFCIPEPEFPELNQKARVIVNLYAYKILADSRGGSFGLNFRQSLEKQINKPNQQSFTVTKMGTIENAHIIKGWAYIEEISSGDYNEKILKHITSNLEKYCTNNFDEKPILRNIGTVILGNFGSRYVYMKLVFEGSEMSTQLIEDNYECKINRPSNETRYLKKLQSFEEVEPKDVRDWTTVPESMQLYGFELSKVEKTEYQDWIDRFKSVPGYRGVCQALTHVLRPMIPWMCQIMPRFPEQNTTVTVKLYFDKSAFNRTNGNCVKTITERLTNLLDANRTEFNVKELVEMGPLYQYKINTQIAHWYEFLTLKRNTHRDEYEHFKTNWTDDLYIKPVILEVAPDQSNYFDVSLNFVALYNHPGIQLEYEKRFENVEKKQPDGDTRYVSRINYIEAIEPLLYTHQIQCAEDEPDRKTDETTETISIGSTSTKNENNGEPTMKPEAPQSPTPSKANVSTTTGTTKSVTKSTTNAVTKSTTNSVTKSTTRGIPAFKIKSTSALIYAFGSTNMVVGAYILFHLF